MLEAVGHPAAVNASWSLKREARKRGWRRSIAGAIRRGEKKRTPQTLSGAQGSSMKPLRASGGDAKWPPKILRNGLLLCEPGGGQFVAIFR